MRPGTEANVTLLHWPSLMLPAQCWFFWYELRNFAAMRVVSEIQHPDCKITIFYWNNKYLIKLEAGPFEQTFKIDEFDLGSESDIRKIVDEDFIQQAMARFADMSRSLSDATDEI